jgi:hypothetical protein
MRRPPRLTPRSGGSAALDEKKTDSEHGRMEDVVDRLAFYPFVVVRIACRVCARRGSYRLARLAAKYGPETEMRDLLERFSFDCLWRAEAGSKRGVSTCGVYLPDLESGRPPDLPPGARRLKLIQGGRAGANGRSVQNAVPATSPGKGEN